MAPQVDARASFLCPEGDALPFPDASFDRACAAVVLQHIVDEGSFRRACAEIRRVLEPGGCVLVIDHHPLADPAPHMKPRGPEAVAEALGLALVGYAKAGAHWVGVFA